MANKYKCLDTVFVVTESLDIHEDIIRMVSADGDFYKVRGVDDESWFLEQNVFDTELDATYHLKEQLEWYLKNVEDTINDLEREKRVDKEYFDSLITKTN